MRKLAHTARIGAPKLYSSAAMKACKVYPTIKPPSIVLNGNIERPQSKAFSTVVSLFQKQPTTFENDETSISSPTNGHDLNPEIETPSSVKQTITLALKDCGRWSREEVSAVLVLPKNEGGVGLSAEDAKPLFDSGFKGQALYNIAKNIEGKRQEGEGEVGCKAFATKTMATSKDFTSVSETTCEAVVEWVATKLTPKPYYQWNTQETIENLCKPKAEGGAGLDVETRFKLEDAKINNRTLFRIVTAIDEKRRTKGATEEDCIEHATKSMNKDFHSVSESTCKAVVEWVATKLTGGTVYINIPYESVDYWKGQWFAGKIVTQDNVRSFNRYLSFDDSGCESNQSFTIILSSFGTNFTFVGRKASMEVVEDVFKKYSSLSDIKTNLDKTEVVLPFIAAAPGVGKSRLLKEMGNYLQLNPFRKGKRLFPLFVSFGNSTSITVYEKEGNVNILQSFIVRLIFSAIVYRRGSYGGAEIFSNFLKDFFQRLNGHQLDLSEAWIIINDILELHDSAQPDFFIAIDEAHVIDSHKNDPLNPLRQVMSAIGRYMTSPVEYFRIFPMFAGTYHTVIEDNLKGSSFSPKFVPIKALLSPENVSLVLDGLVTENPQLKNWRTDTKFRHYLRTFSGLPRGIENFLEEYLTGKSKSNPLEAWELAKMFLRGKYAYKTETAEPLLRYILTKQIIGDSADILPGTQFTFSQLENSDAVLLNPVEGGFQAIYPPVLLQRMIANQYLSQVFANLFLKPATDKVYGFYWEDTVHEYFYLILSLLRDKYLKVGDLFPNGRMSDNTRNLEFLIPDVERQESLHKIEGKKTTITFKNDTEIKPNNLKSCYVIKNAATAQAGDLLVLGLRFKSNLNVILHIQCKWPDSETGTLTFSSILGEVEKNKTLQLDSINTKHITVIMTGKLVPRIDTTFPDDLIIVDKTNFSAFFGMFADQMNFLYAKESMHINELNENQLTSFLGIGKETASKIISARPEAGFKDMKDLKRRLKSVCSKDGKNRIRLECNIVF